MASEKKIVTVSALKRRLAHDRRQGKQIAFTNGCFDILHVGHVVYLEAAKKKNRVLIVGLNSDASVQKIKGPTRPVNAENDRARVLAALSCVDYVTIFSDETPYALIKAVQPDVLIKGGDWAPGQVVGADIVQAKGGKVEIITYRPEFSTTKIIKKIQTPTGRDGKKSSADH